MLKVLFVGAKALSFEIENDDKYFTNEYKIYLNDEFIKEVTRIKKIF